MFDEVPQVEVNVVNKIIEKALPITVHVHGIKAVEHAAQQVIDALESHGYRIVKGEE